MKDKLLKIARYLGQNGFYKEAAELKKLASYIMGDHLAGTERVSPDPEFPVRAEALKPGSEKGPTVSKWVKLMMHGPHLVQVSMPEDAGYGRKEQFVKYYNEMIEQDQWVELEKWKNEQGYRDSEKRHLRGFDGFHGARDEALRAGRRFELSDIQRLEQAKNWEQYDRFLEKEQARNRERMISENEFDQKMRQGEVDRLARRGRPGGRNYAMDEGSRAPSIQEEISQTVDRISSMSPFMQGSVISEIQDMADGGDADGIREEFYPSWQNKDFQAVLDILKKQGTTGRKS